MKKIKACVINHGHMDIEWYQPLTTFRNWFRESLEVLYKIVKTDRDYQCYVYDGAVFPILCAVENDKTLKEKVKELIASGKLKIGPFYTQFDEFLTCGESIIKNCLWGDRACRDLGGYPMKAGYLLDNFGHPTQLPQILNNFQIKSLFFSRGMCDIGNQVREFIFRSPDGSAIRAQNISYSTSFRIYDNNDPRPGFPNYLPYYQNEFLTYEYLIDISKHKDHVEIAKQLINGVKENARFYPSGIVPVFAGCDHCPPQEGLPETLALANAMQDKIEFVFSDAETLSDMLNETKCNMAEFSGDLIGSKFDLLLFGAMTARIYLKQAMYSCERSVFDYALPLAAYTKYLGDKTTQKDLDEAVRLLMINSTHDSIHGSSIDAVHRENEFRFDRAAQLCASSIHDSLQKISAHLSGGGEQNELVVFSPRDYDGYISAWLNVGSNDIILSDAEGTLYDTVITPQCEIPCNAKGQPYYTRPVGDSVREVIFRAKLNAGQVKKFFYHSDSKPTAEFCAKEEHEICNEYYTLSVKNGRLILTDNAEKRTISGFLKFTEEADTGDTFDFSSPWKESASYDSDMFSYTEISTLNCRLYRQLSAKCSFRIPLETLGDERSDSLTDMPIHLNFRLWEGIKRLDIHIKIENYSKNHRVRAVFSFPFAFENVKANELFCSEDFSVQRPPMTADWWEEPTKELPFRDWISVHDEQSRYTVAAKGLYAFEPLDNKRIAFTLFRSVGELMRINLKNRSGCCAAGYPVREAQCLREMNFDFSLITHPAEDSTFEIEKRVEQFTLPPAVHAVRQSKDAAKRKSSFTLYRFIDNASFVVSVFELSYDQKYYLLRFYEKNGRSETARIELSSFKTVFLSDMNETVREPLIMNNGVVELNVPANKVITLLMKK